MDDTRKKIIIAEIENWRKNSLLPEHYCIFLLNLYSEGERPVQPSIPSGNRGKVTNTFTSPTALHPSASSIQSPQASNSPTHMVGSDGGVFARQEPAWGAAPANDQLSAISWKMVFAWFVGASVIAVLILLAFHFNGFGLPMQMAIFTSFLFIFYMLAFLFKRKAPVLTHISLIIVTLLLIFGGFYFLQRLDFPRSSLLIYIGLLCLFWCFNGFLFRFAYLLYGGILGLGILYGNLMVERVGNDYSWWQVELYWVPIAVLMIGLGFLLHQRNTQLAGVLGLSGVLYFFGAEIASLYIPTAKQDIIQLLLFIKVFIVSGLFFFTRGYWFSWLRL